MPRTFFVRINLDDLCADLDTLRPDQHAEWLAGFRAGSRGRVPDGWDGPRLMGAEFGMAAFRDAERFREHASIAGRASAEARRAKTESTETQRELNASSTTVERPLNDCSTQTPTIQYPISNIQEPAADLFSGGEESEPKPLTDRELIQPLAGMVKWTTNEPERTAANVAELATLVRTFGAQAVERIARGLFTATGSKVWPDALGPPLAAERSARRIPKPPPPPPDWTPRKKP